MLLLTKKVLIFNWDESDDPSLDDILLFYHCEPIENAPLYNHCRFPYCIPRTERGVGNVFYKMLYSLLELGFKQIYSLYKFKLMRQHVEDKLLCKRCKKIVPSDYVNEIIPSYLIEL